MRTGSKIIAWVLPLFAGTLALHGTTALADITVTGANLPSNPDTWSSSTTVYIGHAADGELLVDDGSTQSTANAYLGSNPAVIGTVTVDGPSSTWNSNQLYIGDSGTGIMQLTNGGQVLSNGSTLGNLSGAHGIVTVDGPNSTWTDNPNANFLVGYHGTGTLNITNGGTVNGGYTYLGYLTGAQGIITVDGPGSNFNYSQLFMGNGAGTSTLNITHGGQVTSALALGYPTYLANGANATVSGAGSTWISHGNLVVGRAGPAALTIADQGAIQITGLCDLTNGSIGLQGGSLTSSHLVVSTAGTFTQTGGTLAVASLISQGSVSLGGPQSLYDTSNVYVYAGTTTLTPDGTKVLSAYSISLHPGAKLDLTNNTFLFHSANLTADTATLQSLLISARNGGTWDGPGLTSSLATNNGAEHHTLALMKAVDLGLTTFKGQPVDDSTLIVTYTLPGDINLDGQITAIDFAQIDAAYLSGQFQTTGAQWLQGDFNYDGKIDAQDFALMDAAFTTTFPYTPAAFARAAADAQRFGTDFLTAYDQALVATPIPEPATFVLLALGTVALFPRRK